tara:strand:+ start:4627 stop:5541 length:915 start_codon:yes stop_codon:yes gene_type:complete
MLNKALLTNTLLHKDLLPNCLLRKALLGLLIIVASGCVSHNGVKSASDKTNTNELTNLLSKPVMNEDFDHGASTVIATILLKDKNLALVSGEGVNGSTGLRAQYQGFHRGSERITARIPLGESGDEYSLNYDVRFESGFQFVKSGKLHGLGPAKPITGGKAMQPAGWSARATFKEKGNLTTYVYHQDKPREYGAHGKVVAPFSFSHQRFYAVSLHVKINSHAETADGFVHLYVDGVLIERLDNIRLHADKENAAISQMLFSTFHGGSSPKYAPRDENGNYTSVYATFDNFSVYRNKRIRLAPGK